MNFQWSIIAKQNKERLQDISFESETHNIYDPKFDSSSEDINEDHDEDEMQVDLFEKSKSNLQIDLSITDPDKNTISVNLNHIMQSEMDIHKKTDELNSYRDSYKHVSLFK